MTLTFSEEAVIGIRTMAMQARRLKVWIIWERSFGDLPTGATGCN